MKIGVFDSGKGGLTILNAVRERLPHYDYIYYGDTKNLPYGDKSEEEIYELTKRAVRELFVRECALVILACNTASAESLRRLQETVLVGEYARRRILGVIIPTVEKIIEGGHQNVLLIGTRRTIDSGKYEKELMKRSAPNVALVSIATPELVPMIERGEIGEAYNYMDVLLRERGTGSTSLILGCTHYTVLTSELRVRYPDLRILSQDEIIPPSLHTYLTRHPEIETILERGGGVEQIITGETSM